MIGVKPELHLWRIQYQSVLRQSSHYLEKQVLFPEQLYATVLRPHVNEAELMPDLK